MAKNKSTQKKIKDIKQQKQKKNPQTKPDQPHSWAMVKNLFTCKHLQTQMQQQQQEKEERKKPTKIHQEMDEKKEIKKCKKINCSGSLCSNTKVMQRPEVVSPEDVKRRASNSSRSHNNNNNNNGLFCRSMKITLNEPNGVAMSSSSSSTISAASSSSPLFSGSLKAMPFRKLSGCYECRMVVDPVLGFARDPSLRATICSCPICGEVFVKAERLELHQATRHAVSELGPDDTSKNIVEIIFQSSWLNKENPLCTIDRVLKVHNTSKTISRFEEYRDNIKSKATKLTKKHPRCIADGNELLRFHCTKLTCSLGLNGSSNLCNSIPHCNICSIIKSGFKIDGEPATPKGMSGKGILTTATSGKAHDFANVMKDDDKRAMLVCRVIAGRVKKNLEGNVEDYDSIAGGCGVYSNLDELYVLNPKAILPCFVVIYRAL